MCHFVMLMGFIGFHFLPRRRLQHPDAPAGTPALQKSWSLYLFICSSQVSTFN